MSLEANLELNNQLLTQNNELMAALIKAMASQPKDNFKVSELQSYVEPKQTKSDTSENEITLEDLKFEDVVALAGMFPESASIPPAGYRLAICYRDAIGDDRNEQTDALLMALSGVTRAKELPNTVLLHLCRTMLGYWDELPGITERREFVERWLDTKPPERKDVKPAKPKAKKERKGPFYWKNQEGDAFGQVDTLDELNDLLDNSTAIEVHKVEYLQLKEAAEKADSAKDSDAGQPDFAAQRKQATDLIMQLVKGGYRAEAVAILEKQGAKKLGEVADEKLAEVIAQAEAALEG